MVWASVLLRAGTEQCVAFRAAIFSRDQLARMGTALGRGAGSDLRLMISTSVTELIQWKSSLQGIGVTL